MAVKRAAKKTAKRPAGGMKRKSASTTKTVRSAAKKTVRKAAKSMKSVSKAAGGAAKRAKKAVSNPRRTVRRAAENVHQSATRARDFGDSVVSAGELIKETADFVDAVSQRAKRRVGQTTSRSRKAR